MAKGLMETKAAERVFCYSGNEYADRPVSFLLEGEPQEISGIIARWRTPEGRRFRVTTADGSIFDLIYCEASNNWKIEEI